MAQHEVTIKVIIDGYESVAGRTSLEPTPAKIANDMTNVIEGLRRQMRYNAVSVNSVIVNGDPAFDTNVGETAQGPVSGSELENALGTIAKALFERVASH